MGKSRLLRRRQEREQQAEPVEKHVKISKKRNFISNIYEFHYKKLMIIPWVLIILSILVIAYQVSSTGDFIQKGVSLKEGLVFTIESPEGIGADELSLALKSEFPRANIDVREYSDLGRRGGLIIETSDIDPDNNVAEEKLVAAVEKYIPDVRGSYSTTAVGSSLGASFFSQTLLIVIFAFVCMSFIVFLYFKLLIPSAAVILATASDILFTVAVVNLMGLKITTAGIAAFLMLIGYSVDTDILLSTRVLRRKTGTVYERVVGSVKTGMMMSMTTICAVGIALIFSQSETLSQIMIILMIGLVADMIFTWIQNAGIIRMYMEKKERQ